MRNGAPPGRGFRRSRSRHRAALPWHCAHAPAPTAVLRTGDVLAQPDRHIRVILACDVRHMPRGDPVSPARDTLPADDRAACRRWRSCSPPAAAAASTGRAAATSCTATLRGRPVVEWAAGAGWSAPGSTRRSWSPARSRCAAARRRRRAPQPTVGRGPGDLAPASPSAARPGAAATARSSSAWPTSRSSLRRGVAGRRRRDRRRSPSPPTTGDGATRSGSAPPSGTCCRSTGDAGRPRRDADAARARDRSSVRGQSRRHRHPRGSPTMELINDFTVNAPIDEAWATLTDVERIAPCLPGAQLTEIEGDTYRGLVKVKVGPITAQFKGQASFVEKDDRAAPRRAQGRGPRHRRQGQRVGADHGPARAGRADVTKVTVTTDLTITGKVAQFGRGALADVSEKLLQAVRDQPRDDRADERRRARAPPAPPSHAAAAADGRRARGGERRRRRRRDGSATAAAPTPLRRRPGDARALRRAAHGDRRGTRTGRAQDRVGAGRAHRPARHGRRAAAQAAAAAHRRRRRPARGVAPPAPSGLT